MIQFITGSFQGLKRPYKGFTLSELLIGVALIGIIATFALPKLIVNTKEKVELQRYRSAISTLSTLCYQAWQQDAVHSRVETVNYLTAHLNFARFENSWPGYVFILHDGTSIQAESYYVSNQQDFRVKVTDTAWASAVHGVDWIYLQCNFNRTTNSQNASGQPVKPGTVSSGIHGHTAYAPTRAVWDKLFPPN